jgi:hypothetical protein
MRSRETDVMVWAKVMCLDLVILTDIGNCGKADDRPAASAIFGLFLARIPIKPRRAPIQTSAVAVRCG